MFNNIKIGEVYTTKSGFLIMIIPSNCENEKYYGVFFNDEDKTYYKTRIGDKLYHRINITPEQFKNLDREAFSRYKELYKYDCWKCNGKGEFDENLCLYCENGIEHSNCDDSLTVTSKCHLCNNA